MDERFRKLFVQQVEGAVVQEACTDSLIKLLQLADPKLSKDDLGSETKRQRAFRQLKLLVHPDKHPKESRMTGLFQRMQTFYDECSAMPNEKKRKRMPTSPTSACHPLEFKVTDKWPYLKVTGPVTSNSKRSFVAKAAAYQCINYRGSIAHGKPTECSYNEDQVVKDPGKTVEEVFSVNGGAKMLTTADEIKSELLLNGPVVSSSFILTRGFLNASEHSASFKSSLIGRTHPILIVGWKLSAFGEMWLVQAMGFVDSQDIPIAMHQFSIEDECWAPISKFEQTPWQSDSKVLDVSLNVRTDEWYSWGKLQTQVEADALAKFAKSLGVGFCAAAIAKTSFVVRDKNKIARSRRAHLIDVSWTGKRWKIDVEFTE